MSNEKQTLSEQVQAALKKPANKSDSAMVADLEKQIHVATESIKVAHGAEKESLSVELKALNAKLQAEFKKSSKHEGGDKDSTSNLG